MGANPAGLIPLLPGAKLGRKAAAIDDVRPDPTPTPGTSRPGQAVVAAMAAVVTRISPALQGSVVGTRILPCIWFSTIVDNPTKKCTTQKSRHLSSDIWACFQKPLVHAYGLATAWTIQPKNVQHGKQETSLNV